MATVQGISAYVQRAVLQTKWTPLTAADVGTAEQLARFPNHSVQFTGTWNSATAVLQGSDDGGATWFTLKDVGGSSVSATSNARFDVVNVPQQTRPSTSGGGGSTSVTCIVTSRSFGH